MTNPKRTIFLVLLFMVIGIAAVTTNVVISGSTNIANNPDDFLVYFSDVKVNGVQDLSLVKNEKQLVFNKEFSSVGQRVEITYDITNASKNYDASISIECTPSTEYLSIVNSYDSANNLGARQSKTGVLTITQSKSYTGADLTQEISCTINATAVERTSQGNENVVAPLNPFYIGREISIGDEKFNVISSDATTVTMLAQKNISDTTPYKQTDEQVRTRFSDSYGWQYTPGPKDIDIQNYDGETRILLNNYVSYLKTQYNVDVTGDLITMTQLGNLGCTIPTDYAWGDGGWTCTSSEHSEWLVNGQDWWTCSAYPEIPVSIWIVYADGKLRDDISASYYGVRPVITISKSLLN